MKTEKNILVAFLLNILFSIIEFIGGIITGSIAIISDAIHDIGDAISIGISYFLEKKSKKRPDDIYTYGYIRYSILGALITTLILISGSIFVFLGAINRIINPTFINYNGMICLAIFGTIINFIAAYITKEGDSLNQKSVNLHMLEDVLGWIVVLIGAILMKITNIYLIDSIMSIGVAIFIFIHALNNLKDILDLFLEKIPKEISLNEIKEHLLDIQGIIDVHHIHIWSIDGYNHYATMHIITKQKDLKKLKQKIKEELLKHSINHVTIEFEDADELCQEIICSSNKLKVKHHHNH